MVSIFDARNPKDAEGILDFFDVGPRATPRLGKPTAMLDKQFKEYAMQAKKEHSAKKAPVGRPRSETTRLQILNATIKLLQKNSIQAISIEAIAKEAGVSKATIYRWWDSKAFVVVDAFIENHLVKTPIPFELGPRKALTSHFRALVEQYSEWPGRLVAQILGEGQSDPAILRAFRERFHYGRRGLIREALEQWKDSGQIPADTNVELLMDIIYGAAYMRLMIGHAPLTDDFARAHLSYIFSLLGVTDPDE